MTKCKESKSVIRQFYQLKISFVTIVEYFSTILPIIKTSVVPFLATFTSFSYITIKTINAVIESRNHHLQNRPQGYRLSWLITLCQHQDDINSYPIAG